MEFLKSPAGKIPVSGIAIGPVQRKNAMRVGVMLESTGSARNLQELLTFNVKVITEAKELAEAEGVRIFTADIRVTLQFIIHFSPASTLASSK